MESDLNRDFVTDDGNEGIIPDIPPRSPSHNLVHDMHDQQSMDTDDGEHFREIQQQDAADEPEAVDDESDEDEHSVDNPPPGDDKNNDEVRIFADLEADLALARPRVFESEMRGEENWASFQRKLYQETPEDDADEQDLPEDAATEQDLPDDDDRQSFFDNNLDSAWDSSEDDEVTASSTETESDTDEDEMENVLDDDDSDDDFLPAIFEYNLTAAAEEDKKLNLPPQELLRRKEERFWDSVHAFFDKYEAKIEAKKAEAAEKIAMTTLNTHGLGLDMDATDSETDDESDDGTHPIINDELEIIQAMENEEADNVVPPIDNNQPEFIQAV